MSLGPFSSSGTIVCAVSAAWTRRAACHVGAKRASLITSIFVPSESKSHYYRLLSAPARFAFMLLAAPLPFFVASDDAPPALPRPRSFLGGLFDCPSDVYKMG